VGAPGVRVYMCPDGVNRSLFPDLRDCPGMKTGPTGIELGTSERAGEQFLGYVPHPRSITITDAELAAMSGGNVTPEPLNTRKLLGIALGAFALLVILILLSRRRKRA